MFDPIDVEARLQQRQDELRKWQLEALLHEGDLPRRVQPNVFPGAHLARRVAQWLSARVNGVEWDSAQSVSPEGGGIGPMRRIS